MGQGKPTTLENILTLMVARIASEASINIEYIIPTLSEDYFDPGIGGLADRYVLISNFSGGVMDGTLTGGGNDAHIWNMVCDVTLFSRLDIDEGGKDYQRLVAASFGVLPKWRLLLKGMNQWNPDDGGAPALGWLAQPARVLSFSITPKKYPRRNGWVQLRSKVQIVFRQDLS